MSLSSRKLVTLGVLAGLSLSSLEISVVGPAAPRIAREIGGLDSYSWLFTAYLLTATLSMPAWGRLSDHWGRKRLFLASLVIFLIGSVLCGLAGSMPELIAYRAIKGLGGGGLLPLAFTLIADIYPFRERSRVQGYLSSVWGLSSIIGPFIGGLLTDSPLGWRAIFFVNLIPGGIAYYLILRHLRESAPKPNKLALSLTSLAASCVFVLLLLLALIAWQKDYNQAGLCLFALSLTAFLAFYRLERTVAHPLIHPGLLKNRIFIMSCLTGFFMSMMVIGLSSFGPLLFQSVLGYTPTQSGELLVPFTIAWTIGSIVSTRMLLTHHYRKLLLAGTATTLVGFLAFLLLFYRLDTLLICTTTAVMGLGMAFNYPIALITTQHSVPAEQMGFATSGTAWIRNLGTTIGTTVMGVSLSLIFHAKVTAALPGVDEKFITHLREHPDMLAKIGESLPGAAAAHLPELLYQSLFWVYLMKFVAVAIAFGLTFLYPKEVVRREMVIS